MTTLEAYGYFAHQSCKCSDCGLEIHAGWRCLKCANEALAAMPVIPAYEAIDIPSDPDFAAYLNSLGEAAAARGLELKDVPGIGWLVGSAAVGRVAQKKGYPLGGVGGWAVE